MRGCNLKAAPKAGAKVQPSFPFSAARLAAGRAGNINWPLGEFGSLHLVTMHLVVQLARESDHVDYRDWFPIRAFAR